MSAHLAYSQPCEHFAPSSPVALRTAVGCPAEIPQEKLACSMESSWKEFRGPFCQQIQCEAWQKSVTTTHRLHPHDGGQFEEAAPVIRPQAVRISHTLSRQRAPADPTGNARSDTTTALPRFVARPRSRHFNPEIQAMQKKTRRGKESKFTDCAGRVVGRRDDNQQFPAP